MPIPFSILIRSYNEVDRIGRTLDAVKKLGQEIVVIDSGSNDGTVALAESKGARVIHNAWQGFGPQRSFGEIQCRNDWIFYIDADEVPTPELIAEILALFAKSTPPHVAYDIRNTMVLPGDQKPHPFSDVRKVMRLTDRRYARVTQDPSWDKVVVEPGKTTGVLAGRQWHYCFRNFSHAISKISYTSSLAAETQANKPRSLLFLRLVIELPLEILKFYLIRAFIFGGWKGFAFSVVQSFGRFSRILKMVEKAEKR